MARVVSTKSTSASRKRDLADKIRDLIVNQRYKAGDRLNETSLAREFKVSRIPVREALMQLEEHGLVVNQPRRGMFVNSLSELDTQQINGVRLVLEPEALKLCRARADEQMLTHLRGLLARMEAWEGGSQLEAAELDLEFHRAIWHYSGNSYLEKVLNSLSPNLFAHRALDGISDDRLRWFLGHHGLLLDVIEGKTAQSPEEVILAHLRTGYRDPARFSSMAIQTPSQVD
jgi:DNA-binding GntR family transcriptional regulator